MICGCSRIACIMAEQRTGNGFEKFRIVLVDELTQVMPGTKDILPDAPEHDHPD